MSKQTCSGRHQTFNLGVLALNKQLPLEFGAEALKGVWFFMPSHWTEANGWGTALGRLRGFPIIYSEGYPTEEEALAAAEDWEVQEPDYATDCNNLWAGSR